MLENQLQKYEAIEIAIEDLEEIKDLEAKNEKLRSEKAILDADIENEKIRRAKLKKFEERKKDLENLLTEEKILLKQKLKENLITEKQFDLLLFEAEKKHLASLLGLNELFKKSTSEIAEKILDLELDRIEKVGKS